MPGRSMPGMEEHLFWIVSRAAGTVALLLSSAAVGVGLTMGGRLVKGRGIDLRAAHEALSLATLVAIVVHAVALLGDSFLNAERRSTSRSRSPPATRSRGCRSGSCPAGASSILGVSYYFRTRIGVARWKRLHRWTALAWVVGIVHSLGEGTDAGTTWFLVCTAIAVVPALVLLDRPPPPVLHPRPLPHMSPTMQARRARVRQIRRTVTAARGHRLHRPVRDHLHPDGAWARTRRWDRRRASRRWARRARRLRATRRRRPRRRPRRRAPMTTAQS